MRSNQQKEKAIIDWAIEQAGGPYVYGATGESCTPRLRGEKMKQYPTQAAHIMVNCPVLSGRQQACGGCVHENRPCFDCAQLTRRALAIGGFHLPSGASSQWKAGLWEHKGLIGPEAARMLCLVFRESGDPARPMSHVGLSLGDGRVVDARSHHRGVLLSPIGAYPWTHYAALPPFPREEPLTAGQRGEGVKALQKLLLGAGFALPRFGADGVFGGETLSALRLAREKLGLPVTDEADEELLNALRESLQKQPEQAESAPREATDSLEERLARLERLVFALTQKREDAA